MSSHARDARRLTPVEVATAGALSGLAVTFGLIAAVTPVFQLLFQVATAVPLAMASLKLRPRASVAAFASTVLLAIAVGGFATAGRSFQAALIGLVIGHLHKKRASWAAVSAVAAGLGVIWGVGTGLAFWILADLRTLGLESIRKSLDGLLTLIAHIPHTGGLVEAGHQLGQWFVDWWWVWIPITRFVGVAFLVLAARWLLGAILRRITLDPGWDPLLDAPTAAADSDDEATASSPLPLTLTDAAFTYPGADHPALSGVTLTLERPEYTVVVGHNGSGKSTLALLLAGATPGAGTRTGGGMLGAAGGMLGAAGGTALVGQRSELLVLGQNVAEDVTWGMSERDVAALDLDALLERVGLAGLADADPRSLSGGQLQRLALAGALARSPRLLISDESTAMIDRDGRADMLDLLASLPNTGIAVVHITHDPAEAARADRVITIRSGRILSDTRAAPSPTPTDQAVAGPAQRHTSPETPRDTSRLEGGTDREGGTGGVTPASFLNADGERIWGSPSLINTEHLWADRVAHTYDLGTPWEKPVLRDVSLILEPGQAMLITGDNGSGKTTLSRVLTGLLLPTWGAVTLGGKPMERRVGDVALSMQFARLQLQRPSVRTDILAAAGHGPRIGSGVGRRKNTLSREEGDRIVERAMSLVGLDPALASRGIDDLSGGQMRRVALAGLLASDPRVLILDEPMAGLDAASRELLISVLDERRRAGLSILVISHDLEGMDDLCDTHRHLREGVLA